MRRYSIHFDRLNVGDRFSKDGNGWVKKSTRTAKIVKPECYSHYWCYFGKNDQCIINEEQAKKYLQGY